ncbi:MAG: hypothetical protein KF894_26095 [Labilithrix sp.]|nr:hypothetical protein [Labilithrix sp.]
MKTTTLALVVATAALCACERRGPAVTGDASTTSATSPLGERATVAGDDGDAAARAPVEPSAGVATDAGEAAASGPARPPTDAGEAAASGPARPPTDAGEGTRRPAWVPSGAALTIVHGADRDRNLGLVAPAPPPVSFAVDAGAYEVDVSVRPKP